MGALCQKTTPLSDYPETEELRIFEENTFQMNTKYFSDVSVLLDAIFLKDGNKITVASLEASSFNANFIKLLKDPYFQDQAENEVSYIKAKIAIFALTHPKLERKGKTTHCDKVNFIFTSVKGDFDDLSKPLERTDVLLRQFVSILFEISKNVIPGHFLNRVLQTRNEARAL